MFESIRDGLKVIQSTASSSSYERPKSVISEGVVYYSFP